MKIATVMVTYNRIEDLKKAISSYESQTCLPEAMIIVDNCSTDGTKEFLDSWQEKINGFEKIVIHLSSNIGGSGGFYTGLRRARETDADWYWIADDDAFLDNNALEELKKFATEHPDLSEKASALCAGVLASKDNPTLVLGHRRRIDRKAVQTIVREQEYQKDYFEINLFTYVGSMIRASAIKQVGLPRKDLFIYYDDLEHSYRLNKAGKIFCIPSSKVFHNTMKHEEAYGSNWRSYYQSRNSMLFLKWHFPTVFKKRLWRRYFQRILLMPIGKYSQKNKLDWDAAKDAKTEKLGISDKYYIGWKAEAGRKSE